MYLQYNFISILSLLPLNPWQRTFHFDSVFLRLFLLYLLPLLLPLLPLLLLLLLLLLLSLHHQS